ncbi:type II toxin-antitoxin system mRNA interferase toxin, RelE/StbE family [Candidatus Gottesmanbacteria bacterium]|nr:type II toxin-antitoxin system mRNA interferase toxin, RelE/StbE family [Candidatus Gottesmanbacteria bacterium]
MPARIDYSHRFDKQLRKAPLEIKIALRNKLSLFFQNPFHPLLNNHALVGKFANFRSINITGDWRAIYKETDDIVVFTLFGTHSQLYK